MKSLDKLRKSTKEKSNKMLANGNIFVKNIWKKTKIEGEETKIAIFILSKMIKGLPVNNNEKKFLKEQSKDLLKILPLILLQGVPVPITPLWLLILKYNPNLAPKDHRDLLKDDSTYHSE